MHLVQGAPTFAYVSWAIWREDMEIDLRAVAETTLAEAVAQVSMLISTGRTALDEASRELVERGLAVWSEDAAQRPVLIVRGQARLLDAEALGDIERVRSLLEDLENKQSVAQLLELARVLMADPAVILLDEPAAGVNPALLDFIIGRIADLNARGTTILLIEHNMEMVARLCSRVIVMAQGRLLREGKPADVASDPAVIEAYLGVAA